MSPRARGGPPVTPSPVADAALGDDRPLWDLLLSYHHFPALAVADDLGIFDLLATSPLDAEGVVSALGLSVRGGQILLRLLTVLGLLRLEGGRLRLTERVRPLLVKESPYYWGAMLRMTWDERCSALREAVKTGAPPGYRGRDLWQTHMEVPRQAEIFTRAMDAHSRLAAEMMARSLDLAGTRRLLDVGAGSGVFSLAMLRQAPWLEATLLDLPPICEIARPLVEEKGMTDRLRLLPADMFGAAWPAGFDLVLLADVFHDWDDERCLELARRSLAALNRDGRVLVHEMLLEGEGAQNRVTAASYSVAMLLTTWGRQRTGVEISHLLQLAGFAPPTVTQVYGYNSVVAAAALAAPEPAP
jgi:2-hydroxy-4-(methylsulfanyl)butanoate S-methyltransferase